MSTTTEDPAYASSSVGFHDRDIDLRNRNRPHVHRARLGAGLATTGGCPPTSAYVVQNAPASTLEGGVTVWCLLPDGRFDTSSSTNGGGALLQYTSDVFYVQAENRRGNDDINAVGRRQQTQPPPPPPGQLKVFITQPAAGATVSGTVWVVMWVEGTTGSSNVFTLSVDGKVIRPETTSSRGPVTIPWFTVNNPDALNGTHTVTATVRDATGKTGTASIAVIVKN
jgi:Big-like domain-containing protein